MAELPYSAVLDDLEQPASPPVLRGWVARNTRSFSWAAGLAWIGLTFLLALLRQAGRQT